MAQNGFISALSTVDAALRAFPGSDVNPCRVQEQLQTQRGQTMKQTMCHLKVCARASPMCSA